MISITLKAKHYYFVSSQLKNIVAGQYFNLLNSIKAATVSSLDDDDVAVSVQVSEVVTIFNLLANKPEGQVNRINTEMNTMLLSQIQANVTPEGTTVSTEVTVQEPIIDPVTGETTGYQDVVHIVTSPAPKTEWDILAEEVTAIRSKNWAITDYAIQEGKLFLHS